jgi:histidinol-phosphate aminotransferase
MPFNHQLTSEESRDFARRGFSRRMFGRLAALAGAGAALPFYNEPALAQLSTFSRIPTGAVRLNANENPLGPCPEALEAIQAVARNGGRYSFEVTWDLVETLVAQTGLKRDYIEVYGGSSDPLHHTVLAFCSPARPFVVADPGYEAGARAAEFIHAPVINVPLTAGYAHDVKRMAAAHASPGVIYVCNPNNPTGTLTSRADIDWLVANKPAGSIVLLDEAYIHYTTEPQCLDLVARDQDVILLRTFSKIYGLAGMRAGAALARPDLLGKIKGFKGGPLPTAGMAGAAASLKAPGLIEQRRKYLSDIREETFAWLRSRNYDFVPSISNKFMLNVHRPGQEVVKALAARNIYVGRSWPVWPTYVRVTIGTREEMAKFQAALSEVLG